MSQSTRGPAVARVVVDVPLAHLDRPFDYAIPEALADEVRPGVRVRVRFAGRLVDGIVIGLAAGSEHRLQPLQRVVSPLAVAPAETLATARAVVDRFGGTLADVLRQAIPPRHARAERRVLALDAPAEHDCRAPDEGERAAWAAYRGGAALLERIAGGAGARAAWNALPGERWADRIATLVASAASAGGSAVVVVPDARDVSRVVAALAARPGSPEPAVLTADLGPEARYAAFLRLLTGRARVAVGTRAAVFAPVVTTGGPGLLVCWEDGEDTLAEPHSPGWHAREVLALRAHETGASLVVGGFSRSAQTQLWIESGWAAAVTPRRDALRSVAPRVLPDDDPGRDPGPSRLPARAITVLREALPKGPVLVQVARRGYVPGLACQDCRHPARCPECGGGLRLPARSAAPQCGSCGAQRSSWACGSCGSSRLRGIAVGSQRTVEELRRSFPAARVLHSGGDDVLDMLPPDAGPGQSSVPVIVVATPGAEPIAASGYAAVLLLDASAHLARLDLRAGEETVRRWFAAAALAGPRAPVVVTAPGDLPAVQALVRWDPGWFAARDLAERTELGLPPAVRAAVATGSAESVAEALDSLPAGARILGPVPVTDAHADADVAVAVTVGVGVGVDAAAESDGAVRVRAHVTVPRASGADLVAAWARVAAARTARKATDRLDLRIDPPGWGSG